MEHLKEKYGIFVAIAMVVGIVIGSGVFFKADDVLIATGGSLPLAILAWFIGGMIMVISAYSFSIAAGRVSKSNGIVDYIEAGYGKRAGFYTGYFLAYIYYPALTGVLAYVAALYTSILFGIEGYGLWGIALIYLGAIVALNYVSPILSGKFQVSATVIKLIPLGLVALVGLVVGLTNGTTVTNFTNTASVATGGGGLATAVLATAFAYEGWIVATSINGELKDAKKTLPKALVIGSLIVMAVYILYYLGLAGTLDNQVFADEGDNAVNIAVSTLFGAFAGTTLTVFVIVSCLGTLNGLMLGTSRSIYSLAFRNQAFRPDYFKEVSPKNNAPKRAILFAVPVMLAWGLIWFGNFEGWFNGFIDTSELPVAFLYAIYIAVYVWIMRTYKEGNVFKRFIAPLLSTAGSIYIMFAAVQKDMFLIFVMIVAVVLLIGLATERTNSRRLRLQEDA
ncbi:MAG: APC family permease [Candidatus Izemoplasmataceae bacterium]